MSKGKNRKNFAVYDAEAFIVAITQHIPERSFQMVRYYGYYSNKSRGLRKKEIQRQKKRKKKSDEPTDPAESLEIIDFSDHRPKKFSSLIWRNCIKKIYEIDPLACPHCGAEMRIISFITRFSIIKKILEHLELWKEDNPRGPPLSNEMIYEPLNDGWFRKP